jgi:hypothetical protein
MSESAIIQKWVSIGKENPWIRTAYDPAFDASQVHEKKSIQELYDHFQHGNWCIGDAPYYQNICFINQVDGGCEYMVIRDDISFESLSADRYSLEKLTTFIERVQKATPEQLRKLKYNNPGVP